MSNPLEVQKLTAFIFDLDGVVWRGDSPVSGVPEAIMQLKAAGKTCLYCTNNASKKPSDYVEKLASMGVEATEEEIMTSAVATAIYLASQLTGQFSAYVVGEEGLTSALQKVGARVATMHGLSEVGDFVIENTAFPVDCVVAGIDRNFNYDKLCMAQNFILNGAQFVATNRDATFPIANGGVVPGAGAIVSAIEAASGVAPLTVGKPQALMPILLMQKFNLDKETTAMVGDRLETDIVAAHRAEIKAIWVESGVATRDKAQRAKGQQKPHAMFRDVVELCAAVLEGQSKSRAAILNVSEVLPLENAAPPTATPPTATPPTATPPTATPPTATPPTATPPTATVATSDTTDDVFAINGANGHAANGSASNGLSPASSAPAPEPSNTITPPRYSFAEVDEDTPSEAGIEPAPSDFSFSLDASAPDTSGMASTPRLAPHLAAPSLSAETTPNTTPRQPAASTAPNTAPEPIQPGVNTANMSNVDEPLDNWWESIEDVFKKK